MYATCEWGLAGASALADAADLFIVVDVLSFSTCVDVACANGASVFPFAHGDRDAARAEAKRLGAKLAGRRSDPDSVYTLSPPSLKAIPPQERLVLPSPNGSRISFALTGKPALAGCLRNARAVARAAAEIAGGGTIAVIPAGEHWPDGSLRPAIEDLLGAGAILAELDAELSPEATVARAAFLGAVSQLDAVISGSISGRELAGVGFAHDVGCALELNVSDCVPVLRDGAYRNRMSSAMLSHQSTPERYPA